MMDWTFLLLDFVPLLVFVVVDSLSNMRYALIAALAAATLEICYSLLVFGVVDEFSILSVALILIFGGLSLKLGNPVYFKLKPSILGVISAGVFFVTYALGKPLLVMAAERYGHTMPDQVRHMLNHPEVQHVFEKASLYLGFGFAFHAAVVAWAAVRLSNWAWFVTRSVGLYAMMVLVVLISRI